MLVLLGLPFWKQGITFWTGFAGGSHSWGENRATFQTSRQWALSLWCRAIYVTEASWNSPPPRPKMRTVPQDCIEFSCSNMVLTVCFFVQLLFPRLSRYHAKLSLSNSQSFPSIWALFQRRGYWHTLWIISLLWFVLDYSYENSLLESTLTFTVSVSPLPHAGDCN